MSMRTNLGFKALMLPRLEFLLSAGSVKKKEEIGNWKRRFGGIFSEIGGKAATTKPVQHRGSKEPGALAATWQFGQHWSKYPF